MTTDLQKVISYTIGSRRIASAESDKRDNGFPRARHARALQNVVYPVAPDPDMILGPAQDPFACSGLSVGLRVEVGAGVVRPPAPKSAGSLDCWCGLLHSASTIGKLWDATNAAILSARSSYWRSGPGIPRA